MERKSIGECRYIMPARMRRALGVRAAEYVEEHLHLSLGGRGLYLVPDARETPAGIARTLTRVLGRPQTVDRGEVAYWAMQYEEEVTS